VTFSGSSRFILGFADKHDAKRVMELLSKPFEKYKLCLPPDKTKFIDLYGKSEEGVRSFDFVGFKYYVGKSLKGYSGLKRKTSSKKFTNAITKTDKWIKINRHLEFKQLIKIVK